MRSAKEVYASLYAGSGYSRPEDRLAVVERHVADGGKLNADLLGDMLGIYTARGAGEKFVDLALAAHGTAAFPNTYLPTAMLARALIRRRSFARAKQVLAGIRNARGKYPHPMLASAEAMLVAAAGEAFRVTDAQAPASKPATRAAPLVRGGALVEQAIARARAQRRRRFPLAAPLLARLRLPARAPLPPSIRAWLAFDARQIPLFSDMAKPRFAAVDFTKFLAHDYGIQPTRAALARAGFADLGRQTKALLPAPMIALPSSANQAHFLYVGRRDDTGEYPVLAWQKEEMWVKYPGFDLYLAMITGVAGDEMWRHRGYREAVRRQEELNLGGKTRVVAT